MWRVQVKRLDEQPADQFSQFYSVLVYPFRVADRFFAIGGGQ